MANPEHVAKLKEGVEAWNRWREENPDVEPDLSHESLSKVDLSKADLKGVNFFQANLEATTLIKAKLNESILREAILEKANVSEANLEGASLNEATLTDTTFSFANLSGTDCSETNFSTATLVGAQLRDANLRRADLRAARGLLGENLGGADLTEAKLPEPIATFGALDRISEIGKHARRTFFIIGTLCVFCWLTIMSTTDAELWTGSTVTPLPIIQTKVSIWLFFGFMPLFLFTLFLYFHTNLRDFWIELGGLPAFFPNGTRLDRRAYPWMLTSLVRTNVTLLKKDLPAYWRIQVVLSILGAWALVPLTMFAFWLRYIPAREWWGTTYFILLGVISLVFAFDSYSLALKDLVGLGKTIIGADNKEASDSLFRRFMASHTALVLSGLIPYYLCFTFSWIATDITPPAWQQTWGLSRVIPNFTKAQLSQVTAHFSHNQDQKGSGEQYRIIGANLRNANLRYAKAEGAFLAEADLRRADLRDANLDSADLRGANLTRAKLQNARLQKAQLQEAKLEKASLHNAKLREASLQNAWLVRADLRDTSLYSANLQKAILNGANLKNAWLWNTNLQNAVLREANLQNTKLYRAQLQKAFLLNAIFKDADLRGADLTGANLFLSDMTRARIGGADLRNTNVNQNQIYQAWGNDETKLPKGLSIRKCLVPEEIKQTLHEHKKWLNSNFKQGAYADFSQTNLVGVMLERSTIPMVGFYRANLQNANLRYANLQKTFFQEACLQNANLNYADLQAANFNKARLQKANLLGAKLQGANLQLTKLQHANLCKADLRDVKLQGADLRGANLQEADFWMAHLSGANFSGANLHIVKNLTQRQLDEACGDEKTNLPEGLTIKPCRRAAEDSEKNPGKAMNK